MTEYTVVLKNGHYFRVDLDSPPEDVWEYVREITAALDDKRAAALGGAFVDIDEVAAIYPTKDGPRTVVKDKSSTELANVHPKYTPDTAT